jgi:hypothetical protein
LKLGKRILAIKDSNGFISALTKGERSYGKTAYDIKNMAYTYYNTNGCNEEDAWQEALNNIIFTPDELLKKVDYNISQDYISPVITIDDAGVHFSSYLFFINVYESSLMNATFDTIRTITHALLINCPTKKRLMSALRNYDDYDISIYKELGGSHHYERKAVAIKWYTLPDGHRKYKKEFEDYFSCYLPDWVYLKYMEQRKKYLKDISDELKVLRTRLRDRQLKFISTIKNNPEEYAEEDNEIEGAVAQ